MRTPVILKLVGVNSFFSPLYLKTIYNVALKDRNMIMCYFPWLITAGWDTDQFLVDIQEATMIMLSVIRNVC